MNFIRLRHQSNLSLWFLGISPFFLVRGDIQLCKFLAELAFHKYTYFSPTSKNLLVNPVILSMVQKSGQPVFICGLSLIPLFTGLDIHPRWLFGISSINTDRS